MDLGPLEQGVGGRGGKRAQLHWPAFPLSFLLELCLEKVTRGLEGAALRYGRGRAAAPPCGAARAGPRRGPLGRAGPKRAEAGRSGPHIATGPQKNTESSWSAGARHAPTQRQDLLAFTSARPSRTLTPNILGCFAFFIGAAG